MTETYIILGAGGHAKVVADVLRCLGRTLLGFVDPDLAKRNVKFFEAAVLGGDEVIRNFASTQVVLANGIGSTFNPQTRRKVFEKYTNFGYRFPPMKHPSAVVADGVVLADGVQVMAGSVIQTGTTIGKNAIVNTRSSLDHDVFIGEHVHVAPGATVCGGVRIEDEAHIGTGAVIIQGVSIGQGSVIGAGSLVRKNVPAGALIIGDGVRKR